MSHKKDARLIWVWVSAVCLCPTKRTLGLYGLNEDAQLHVSSGATGLSFGPSLCLCPYLYEQAVMARLLAYIYNR